MIQLFTHNIVAIEELVYSCILTLLLMCMDVQAGAVKGQNHIHIWTRDIVNHFWYCSKQASTEEEFKVCLKVKCFICLKNKMWQIGFYID